MNSITRIPKFRRCVLQNFPFIEQDFDALTDYELLCKVVEYLNKVIDSQNEVTEQTAQLVSAFNTLQSYVDTYFDNLDVQEEVNKKLDQMVEDGTLDSIVQKVLGLYDTYHFHTIMATPYYRSNEQLFGMQGGCFLPDNTIFQCSINSNYSEQTVLCKYATNGSILNQTSRDYGHSNGVTYNTKTESVFITSTQSDTIGKYKIFEVNPSNLNEIRVIDASDKNFPAEPYGIVYIEEEDCYIFCNYWVTTGTKYLWKTDADFNVISTQQINIAVRSTSNIGRFGNYIGVNTITDRNVMLFNFDLSFFKQVNIDQVVSDTWCITEVEWFDTRNGKIYLGFIPASATSPKPWGNGTKVYAVFDPALNYNEIRKTGTEFAPYGEVYYVNYTNSYNPLRDGSYDAPFANINEALNAALRTDNITGSVNIYITQGETTDTFYPFFTMNKKYKVVVSDGTTNTTFGGIYVGNGAEVSVSKGINITTSTALYNDCKVFVNGKLYVDGYLKMSDGSKLSVGGDNSSEITANIDVSTSGFDFTAFYGKFTNIGANYVADSASANFLTLRTTDSLSQLTFQLINYRATLPMISSGSNTYQLPNFAPTTHVAVRFTLPNGSSTFVNEMIITYIEKLYSDTTVPYVTSANAREVLHIKTADTGVLSFTNIPTAGLVNPRVKICTAE